MPEPRAIIDIAQRTQGTHDPTVERHKRELFGTPNAADPSPPESRHVAPGRVQLHWIGERGPLAEEKIAMAIQLGIIPPRAATALELMQCGATTAIPGVTSHSFTPERDGVSETYTFGPVNFICDVTTADADRILSGTFGHQFRVLRYRGWQPADQDPIERHMNALKAQDLVTDEQIVAVKAVAVREHETQALTGIVAGSGGRMGAWTPKP